MLPVERHRFITEVLSQRGRVMVQEVAQLCHISIETARRDLALLERRGLLLRSHGGAVFVEPPAVEKTYVPAEIDQGNLSASAATRRRNTRRALPNARWNLSRRGTACCWTAVPPVGFWRANCRISRWWC
ncbi:deoR-like helix-turn-helix domain protein [Serratia marcescens]|nr:deoR-like helix-turn-helix domain protein [Serratia marcescens]